MSASGCAPHICSFLLPQVRQASAVTVTKPLTAEILEQQRIHLVFNSCCFLFALFIPFWGKWCPFPSSSWTHHSLQWSCSYPFSLSPLPLGSATIPQYDGLPLCLLPSPSLSAWSVSSFLSSASLTHPLPTNHWSSTNAALPAFNTCCIACC